MKNLRTNSAFNLAELMIAIAVGVLALAAAFSAAITVQRCFVASEEFAADKREQSRLNDYLAMDLRRARSVTGPNGNILLTVTVPQYFDVNGNPVTPTIIKSPDKQYVATYGSTSLTITYRKYGGTVTRTVGSAAPVVIAEGVDDFDFAFDGIGTREFIDTRISFQPHLQRSGTPSTEAKTATTVYNTVRLRNPM